MAALGAADPDWAELPWGLLLHPAYVASVIGVVFIVSFANRGLGILAVLICATPMFMVVAAPPAGIVGAMFFFGIAVALGMFGFVAAVAADAVAKRVHR